jgi:SEC-C motif-containing protein
VGDRRTDWPVVNRLVHEKTSAGVKHNVRVARSTDVTCPCRVREATPVRYVGCCGHWHEGLVRSEHAPTPESLMRSRYSAYALVQGRGTVSRTLHEYLIKTWHPSTAPGDLELGPMNWTGLDVLHQEACGDAAVVEFVAHHKINGRAGKLHEMSRFVREGGAWLYVDGVIAPGAQGEGAS